MKICLHKWDRHIQSGNLSNFADIPIGTFYHEYKICRKCGIKKDLVKKIQYEK